MPSDSRVSRYGPWAVEMIGKIEDLDDPLECRISQRSVRIIMTAGVLSSIELDRRWNPPQEDYSQNRSIETLLIDGREYRVQHRIFKPQCSTDAAVCIDDPGIKTVISEDGAAWMPLNSVFEKLLSSRQLVILGGGRREIAAIKLESIGKIAKLCGYSREPEIGG